MPVITSAPEGAFALDSRHARRTTRRPLQPDSLTGLPRHRHRHQRPRQVQRVAGMPVPGQSQAMQPWQQRPHCVAPTAEPAMHPPGCHHDASTPGAVAQDPVVQWTNGIRGTHQVGGSGRPERKQIGHAQTCVAPALRKGDAASYRRVIAGFIRRAGIEPHEHGVAVDARPVPPQVVPVGPAR